MPARDIDEVLQTLDALLSKLRDERNRRAYFAAVYRVMTAHIKKAIDSGRFEDSDRMIKLDTVFANRYFAAVAADRSNEEPPRSWKVAFDTEGRSDAMILQHVLLGINAHINFDLPIATTAVATAADLPSLKSDFFGINQIISGLLDPVQNVLGEFSPLLGILDHVGGRTDESIATFSVVTAREEAWHEATRLATENEAQQARSIISLDRRVALLAQRILVPGGLLGQAMELIARLESDNVVAVTDALLNLAKPE